MYQGKENYRPGGVVSPSINHHPATGTLSVSSENLPDRQEKVRVWPELVLWEAIAALAVLIPLVLFSIYLAAPLEEVADPSYSMNPSKAPWYFLGLQELLVYFTPWIAGVTIPLVVIGGLMLIPFLDSPPSSSDRTETEKYPFAGRIRLLFGGGLGLWLILTVVGLFFRGKNWDWQWPDGTPFHLTGHSMGPLWLPVPVVAVYLLISFHRRRRSREAGVETDFIRRLLTDILSLTVLVVALQIFVTNILNFLGIS